MEAPFEALREADYLFCGWGSCSTPSFASVEIHRCVGVETALALVLACLSLLEAGGMRKLLKIKIGLAKVCSHFPTLFLP